MRHSWQEDVLETFGDILLDGLGPDDLGGKSGQSFGQKLKGVVATRLPEGRIKRSKVFALAADASVNTITICAAAMAWGGMNERYSGKFFDLADQGWLAVAEMVRSGQLSRQDAYTEFSKLREADKLYGVGPAYFTKLIYFLTPRDGSQKANPFIMDQWAGCSINLFVNRELVKMDVTRSWGKGKQEPKLSYRVADANTSSHYEAFCAEADALCNHFGLSADEMDRALVANGGQKKSSWRKYVIKNRRV